MKQIIFLIVFIFSTFSILAVTKEIDLSKDPIAPGPRPLSLTIIPVSATISETELSVYFETSVGNAIITVYDNMHQILCQQTVATNSTLEFYLPSTEWATGDYTLTVTYGTTNLTGEFQME
ncbi:MAG: DUF3244 domain-containing protein [Paludibacter sp.]